MNELNIERETKRLCGEVNAKRITVGEAVSQLAELVEDDVRRGRPGPAIL